MSEPLIPEDELKRILGMPEGRTVMRAIIGQLGLFRQQYVAGDPETTAFNCGSHNYALAFFDACFHASPEMTAIMLREMKNDGPDAKRKSADSDTAIRYLEPNLPSIADDDGNNPFIG